MIYLDLVYYFLYDPLLTLIYSVLKLQDQDRICASTHDNFVFQMLFLVLVWNTGWGTNEKLIISILAHRTSAQRSLIRSAYAAAYNEDLLKALDKELSSDFEVIYNYPLF